MLEGFAANMGPQDGPPTEELRSLLERHFPGSWFEAQLRSLATQMAGWDPDRPEVTVDLRSVKASILADPEAIETIVPLASSAPDDDGPLADLPEITPETLERVIPEEIVLVGSEHPDRIASVTSAAENVRRIRALAWALVGVVGLLVGLLMLAVRARLAWLGGIMLAVRARLAWLGGIMLLIAIPTTGIAWAAPSLGRRAASVIVPGQPPHAYRVLASFLEQLVSPVLVSRWVWPPWVPSSWAWRCGGAREPASRLSRAGHRLLTGNHRASVAWRVAVLGGVLGVPCTRNPL